jgi:tetratricopeptide (TPR) repeat protein
LKDQRGLIALQQHHLTEQFKQLRLNIWQQRMGILLRIATGFVGLTVAAGLAFMIWNASQSSGLLIEPFSVPPDLAARGMTGQVVAAKLLDHLSEMQAQTNAERPAQTYANDWGQAGIKLDIPETGVSLTELDDFLREKLGHDTHVTGEIVRTASGVSLTARTGMEGAESVTGSEAELDGLVRQLSEKVYRLTQPYRYGIYLASHDRLAEAIPVMKAVAEIGPTRLDRAFGYGDWGLLAEEQDGIDTQLRLQQRAMALEPDNISAELNLGYVFAYKSLPEQAVREYQKALTLLASNKLGMYSGRTDIAFKGFVQASIDPQLGDFRNAAQIDTQVVHAGTSYSPDTSAELANMEADEHDLATSHATLVDTANYRFDYIAAGTALDSLQANMRIDSDAQNWAGVLSDADAFAPMLRKYPGLRSFLPTVTVPLMAYAEARLGKIADAEKHIAATPADCYDCLITRARIAELEGQHGRADWWFARAIFGQKSIPFAYAYWGQALLERGDPDAAIAKFTLANQKGPHFADPLEGWGEALMKKNRSDLALAKFDEAEKYAPNWGRLHLKWGEALGYAGKKYEAQKQYALAAGLDLSSADKAELAKVSRP